MARFAHLHVHSHYSLLDGLPQIGPLVSKAAGSGQDALALTDHGYLYGAIEFYEACRKQGVKPLLGMEAYVAPRSRTERSGRGGENDTSHLTLIAKDVMGYRNLMLLSTRASLEGFYYKPRVDHELLRAHGKGIIALSGCLNGEIPKAILANEPVRARELVKKYQEAFGKDFYFEIQHRPTLREQGIVNEGLRALGEEFGIPLVATQDSHYLVGEDAEAQDLLVCIQTGKTVDDVKRLDMRGVDVSLPPAGVMEEWFRDFPGACATTGTIADSVNLELELGKWVFPAFEPPGGRSAREHLDTLSHEMLNAKYGGTAPPEVVARLESELAIISKKGYDPYFLVVADYTNWARGRGIISTTRGSAAGSLVSYAIGICDVNPLFFKLPFERFLNPSRPSPPDIDMDFADNRRDEVLEYVKGKYGRDKVAQICTFGTLLARAAVRDVTRALGMPYAFGDRVAKLIPPGAQGFPMTVDRALEENVEFRGLYDRDPDVKRVVDLAKKVEGCARHSSVHAAGVVIAPTPLTDFTPLQKEAGGGDKVITQFDMNAVEAAGLLKMDFLGIRNLSILGNAIELVARTKGAAISLLALPLDDRPTYEMLSRGETFGVFQLASEGMTKYLKELRPSTIFDLQAMVALYRPGPIESIPEFIARKNNPARITYLDPRMRGILEQSYGVITYQDDVLLISIELAGYSWEEADKFRKAMGKKIPEEMAKQKEKFWAGIVAHGGSEQLAADLWRLIEPFAAYGFNKAHAASYAMVAFQTAYMKAHYPAEYMTAIMTAESDDLEKVAVAVAECGRMGVSVLPPDVNSSFRDFTYIDDTHIRFGLLAIKNLGSDTVQAIIDERTAAGPFASIEGFLSRLSGKALNRKSLESLVKSGALDAFGDRQAMLDTIEAMLEFAREHQKAVASSQSSLFGSGGVLAAATVRLPPGVRASRADLLAWEKELLGLYVSEHPWKQWEAMVRGVSVPVSAALQAPEGGAVTVGGVITSVKTIQTKSNETMAFCRVEDPTGAIEAVVFPSVYRMATGLWASDRPVIIDGKISSKDGVPKLLVNRAETVSHVTVPRIRVDFAPVGVGGPAARAEAGSPSVPVSISVPPTLSPTLVAELRTVFERFPGAAPVELVTKESGRLRRIRTSYAVTMNEALRAELTRLLGASALGP